MARLQNDRSCAVFNYIDAPNLFSATRMYKDDDDVAREKMITMMDEKSIGRMLFVPTGNSSFDVGGFVTLC